MSDKVAKKTVGRQGELLYIACIKANNAPLVVIRTLLNQRRNSGGSELRFGI